MPTRQEHAASKPAWQRAFAEAQRCYAEQAYAEGLFQLEPYMAELPSFRRADALMLLGACGIYIRPISMWEPCLLEAHALFQAAHDQEQAAQVDVILADGLIKAGQLKRAHTMLRRLLRQSVATPSIEGLFGQALYCSLGQLLMRQMDIPAALEALEKAVVLSVRQDAVRGEILARLFRAQAHASLQQTQAAAMDLLWAERLLASGRFAKRPVGLELLRVETLWMMMCPQRAQSRLQQLYEWMQGADVLAFDKAHWYRLAGSISPQGPMREQAMRQLQRGGQIFAKLGMRYAWAQCQLGLLKASESQSSKHARQVRLRGLPWHEWPVLKQQYQQIQNAPSSLANEHLAPMPKAVSGTPAWPEHALWSFLQAFPKRVMTHLRGFIELATEDFETPLRPIKTPVTLRGRIQADEALNNQASRQASNRTGMPKHKQSAEHTQHAVMRRRMGVTEVTT